MRRPPLISVWTRQPQQRIRQLAQRRVDERQPLAWLLGKTQYCGAWFTVEPGIVVPRSPIGPLLQDGLQPWLARPPRRILDLCCGSGCLGLLAAKQFPAAKVTLVDADPRAANLARRNAVALGLAGRTEVVCADLFDDASLGAFDLILCNPPYVDAADLRTLPPEFAHEPALGLAGGEDGLDVVRRIIDQAPAHLEERRAAGVRGGHERLARQPHLAPLAIRLAGHACGGRRRLPA